jgi:hypothetical protein
MAKIMGSRSRLHHDMIKTTKIMKQFVILSAEKSHSDRTSDRCHLDRVGEPVVYDSTSRHGSDHLCDVGQPRERARKPDPLEVSAELRLARRVRTVRFRMRPGQPGIHVPHVIEPRHTVPPAGRNLCARRFQTVCTGCNVCRPYASCVKLANLGRVRGSL